MTERYVQWIVREDKAPWTTTDCYTVEELEETVARLQAEGRTFTVFPLGVRP